MSKMAMLLFCATALAVIAGMLKIAIHFVDGTLCLFCSGVHSKHVPEVEEGLYSYLN